MITYMPVGWHATTARVGDRLYHHIRRLIITNMPVGWRPMTHGLSLFDVVGSSTYHIRYYN